MTIGRIVPLLAVITVFAAFGITAKTSAQGPIFAPVVTYDSHGYSAAGGTLGDVAIQDVNGDGKPDVVVVTAFSSNTGFQQYGLVSVLLGNGDGTFRAAVTFSSGGFAASFVAVADVNGDGKPDIVVTNKCPAYSSDCLTGRVASTVGVLLGNGDGTFQPAVTYNLGGYEAVSVTVADVNGDGRPDLLAASSCAPVNGACTNGGLSVLLGNGDGTFQPAVTYSSGGYDSSSMAVRDVNGDGKLDLVVANLCPTDNSECDNRTVDATVGVLLGNDDGTFQPAVTSNIGVFNPSGIAIADLNSDGKPDVVVGSWYAGVTVLFGNGDGAFQPAVTYSSGGYGALVVAVADVNGDGKLDLVDIVPAPGFGNFPNGVVGVLFGNGDGTFQPALTYSPGGQCCKSWLAVGDLNGDGKPDVVVLNGVFGTNFADVTIGVLLNISKPPASTTLTSNLNPSIYGQKVIFSARVTTTGPVPPTGSVVFTWQFFAETFTIGTATLNSNGVATLVKTGLNADLYPLTAVYRGDVNNLGSASPVLNQTVLPTTSAATITSSLNPSRFGQAVTFTVKIHSPTVMATGPVTFTAGARVLGRAQLSGGRATFTTSSLAAGSTRVTVTYYGDSNIAKSSASVTQTVHQ
jgi:hypothetical protein